MHKTNCKNCGAPLNAHGNCDYCGTKTQAEIKSKIELSADRIVLTCNDINNQIPFVCPDFERRVDYA